MYFDKIWKVNAVLLSYEILNNPITKYVHCSAKPYQRFANVLFETTE